jgi:hypothetical protein
MTTEVEYKIIFTYHGGVNDLIIDVVLIKSTAYPATLEELALEVFEKFIENNHDLKSLYKFRIRPIAGTVPKYISDQNGTAFYLCPEIKKGDKNAVVLNEYRNLYLNNK